MTDATADRHVFGLDLLRAGAILMVVAGHYDNIFAAWYGVPPHFRILIGSFFGVELFFVLSGFLIGRLLIEIVDGTLDRRAWLVFMVRRWLRTLPLYLLCVAIFSLCWRPHFWEPDHGRLWQDLPYYLTLTQNLAWPMVDDWFAVSWSLTVEEWFYLFFSAVLLAGAAWQGPRWFLVATAVFLVAPTALRWFLPADVNWDEVTSKVVFCRLDAIAFGAVVAWVAMRRPAWLRFRAILCALGVLLIWFVWTDGLSALFRHHEHVRRIFIFDFVSVGFALMLPAAAAPMRVWWPLVWTTRAISRQSYALYLIHLTLAEMVTYWRPVWQLGPTISAVLTCAAVWFVSAASFRWFERPILAWRPAQHPRLAPCAAPGRAGAIISRRYDRRP